MKVMKTKPEVESFEEFYIYGYQPEMKKWVKLGVVKERRTVASSTKSNVTKHKRLSRDL